MTLFRPAAGARVLKPCGTPVSDQGEELPETPYFARAIAAGDLIPAPKAEPATKPGSNKA